MGAVNGAGKEELLSERFSPVPGYWERYPLAPPIDEIARGSFKRRRPPEIQGTVTWSSLSKQHFGLYTMARRFKRAA